MSRGVRPVAAALAAVLLAACAASAPPSPPPGTTTTVGDWTVTTGGRVRVDAVVVN